MVKWIKNLFKNWCWHRWEIIRPIGGGIALLCKCQKCGREEYME